MKESFSDFFKWIAFWHLMREEEQNVKRNPGDRTSITNQDLMREMKLKQFLIVFSIVLAMIASMSVLMICG